MATEQPTFPIDKADFFSGIEVLQAKVGFKLHKNILTAFPLKDIDDFRFADDNIMNALLLVERISSGLVGD